MSGSLEAMLPAKTNNPELAKLPPNVNLLNTAPGVPAGGGGGDITVVLGTGTNLNAVVSQPISTMGANGNSATVQANAAQMLAIAAKYSQTAPELSNSIIKLGQLGQQMGHAIDNNDAKTAGQVWDAFATLYREILVEPGVYQKLKPEDQKQIQALTNQSAQLTADFTKIGYAGYTGLDDYRDVPAESNATSKLATQVQGNSNQTVQCGQNLSCN